MLDTFSRESDISNVHARKVEQTVEAECVWPSNLFVSQFLVGGTMFSFTRKE